MNLLKTRFFRHYKNKPYRFLGIVRHSETLEEMALYETLYANEHGKLWVRPKEMFFENVTIAGVTQPRFRPIEFKFKNFSHISEFILHEIESIQKICIVKPDHQVNFMKDLEGKDNIHCQIVYDGQNAVAMKLGYALSHDRFFSWLDGVLPEFQGLGIAAELMRKQHAWCAKQGFKSIETRTTNEFAKMIQLNLANGFKITGTLPNDGEIKIILEKDLS